MNIKINEIRNNIFLLKFKNQYDVTSTFMRLQEFYESPYTDIRDHYFTLEQYMDKYAENNENFTYTIDWAGFNVPDNIIRNFFSLFSNNLLVKEKNLYNEIEFLINRNKKFYLLGIYEDYKRDMDIITKSLDSKFRSKLKEKLIRRGYCNRVLNDEIQAYMATSEDLYLLSEFRIGYINKNIKEYRKVFNEKEKIIW